MPIYDPPSERKISVIEKIAGSKSYSSLSAEKNELSYDKIGPLIKKLVFFTIFRHNYPI